MNVPDNLLYTKSHEWIRREGDNVRVGTRLNGSGWCVATRRRRAGQHRAAQVGDILTQCQLAVDLDAAADAAPRRDVLRLHEFRNSLFPDAPRLPDPRRVLQLAGRMAKSQVEGLLLGVDQLRHVRLFPCSGLQAEPPDQGHLQHVVHHGGAGTTTGP